MAGGYFKFHWVDPQEITYKIDDPKSPLTAMFKGAPLVVHDETYTFNQESFSRENVHVLTSIDYSKMSDADKAKEPTPRTDHDYALSYIRREGQRPLLLHGARAQRTQLCGDATPRAPARGCPVCARRPEG